MLPPLSTNSGAASSQEDEGDNELSKEGQVSHQMSQQHDGSDMAAGSRLLAVGLFDGSEKRVDVSDCRTASQIFVKLSQAVLT